MKLKKEYWKAGYGQNILVNNDTNIIVKDLINEIGLMITQTKDDFFKIPKKFRSRRTQFIKEHFINLGERHGNKVYANGVSKKFLKSRKEKFVNTEWLYDLQWYTEPKGTNYQTSTFPLVLECEWDIKRKEDKEVAYSAVKYDFQKIVVSTALIKVMIFKLICEEELQDLKTYFSDTISFFSQGTDSVYLFFGFCQRDKDVYCFKSNNKGKYEKYIGKKVLG